MTTQVSEREQLLQFGVTSTQKGGKCTVQSCEGKRWPCHDFHWYPSPWELTEALLTAILSHCLYKEVNYWGPISLSGSHLRLSKIISPECVTRAPPLILLCSHQWSLSESISARWEGAHSPSPARILLPSSWAPLHSEWLCVSVHPTVHPPPFGRFQFSLGPSMQPAHPGQSPAPSAVCTGITGWHHGSYPNNTLTLNQPVWFLYFLYT